MKEIIVYFSRTGENYIGGKILNITKGNTEIVAEKIATITGDDLFKVEPVEAYSDNYDVCIEQAKMDLSNNKRPELVTYPTNLDQYDSMILCFPNYWSHVPVAISAFLEKYDFTGKVIKPVCTHEGSGMGSTESDIKKSCEGAIVKKGLALQGSSVNDSDNAIKRWLRELGASNLVDRY